MLFRSGSFIFLLSLIVCVFSSIGLNSIAYAVHNGAGGLTCGTCHAMHNSQGAGSLGGVSGGSLILLRAPVITRNEIHKLCLKCHADNGSQAAVVHIPQGVQAPKVFSSAQGWTDSDPFNEIGAGGNFFPEIDISWNVTTGYALGRGHSLGSST